MVYDMTVNFTRLVEKLIAISALLYTFPLPYQVTGTFQPSGRGVA